MDSRKFLIFLGLPTLIASSTLVFSLSSSGNLNSTVSNEVRLLLEGYMTPIDGREIVPGASDNGARRVASTMGLIKGDGAIVFVDPGFVSDRSLIFDALDQADVRPENVTHLFISHHHPDHTINAALFPNATVVDFWATYQGDLWEDHSDNFEITPGVSVMRTPGHTNEDASLIVDTEGGTVVFTHVWWTETLFPLVDPIGDDAVALEASRQLVLDVADCIIPGHGAMFPNPQKPDANCNMIVGNELLSF